MEKICICCKQQKAESKFPKGRNKCKACYNEEAKLWALANPEKAKAKNKRAYDKGKRVCGKCNVPKLKSEFDPHKQFCKICSQKENIAIMAKRLKPVREVETYYLTTKTESSIKDTTAKMLRRNKVVGKDFYKTTMPEIRLKIAEWENSKMRI